MFTLRKWEMEPMLVASLVVKMNIEHVYIKKKGDGANVGSEFGCENEY